MLDYISINLIFKNEILVKLNQVRRIRCDISDVSLSSAVVYTKSLSCFVNLLYAGILQALTLFSFLACIINKTSSHPIPDSAFIYVDKRLIRFSNKKYPAYNIGLYKYLAGRGKNHLYRYLTLREIWHCFIAAFRLQKPMMEEIHNISDVAGLTSQQLSDISGFGYLRCLDLLFAKTALSKLHQVECAGHFDIYTALISQLRQAGVIKHFSGIQHGLFEYFPFSKPNPLFFDEYQLLFCESQPYFQEYLNANPDCIFHIRDNKPAFDHCIDLGVTVAVALQNDDEESDGRLLDELQTVARGRFAVLAYVHPGTSAKGLARLRAHFPAIRFEPKLRCVNISAVITRYSTLAMDYVAIGIPAIFWAAPDRVCVSFASHPLIHEITDIGALSKVLDGIFALQGVHLT